MKTILNMATLSRNIYACASSYTKNTQFLADLPGASERLTFHKADLLVQGSFDEVIKGFS